jgi:hypothetical protein
MCANTYMQHKAAAQGLLCGAPYLPPWWTVNALPLLRPLAQQQQQQQQQE